MAAASSSAEQRRAAWLTQEWIGGCLPQRIEAERLNRCTGDESRELPHTAQGLEIQCASARHYTPPGALRHAELLPSSRLRGPSSPAPLAAVQACPAPRRACVAGRLRPCWLGACCDYRQSCARAAARSIRASRRPRRFRRCRHGGQVTPPETA